MLPKKVLIHSEKTSALTLEPLCRSSDVLDARKAAPASDSDPDPAMLESLVAKPAG
jgi:hypothetical protein